MGRSPKLTLKCMQCGVDVVRMACQIAKSGNVLCSRECASKFHFHGSMLTCIVCGKVFYRQFAEQKKSKNKDRTFCSSKCYNDMRRKNMKPNVYPKRKGTHKHRILAAKMLGRDLKDGEVVHHIDGNIHNNEPYNLHVFKSQAEHAGFHMKLRKLEEL